MSDERTDAIILGRKIGSYTDWDMLETNSIVLYEFEPGDGVSIPNGDLSVLYDDGLFEIMDDDGNITFTSDIMETLQGKLRHG